MQIPKAMPGQMSPYRLLLMAVLALTLVAQVVALVLVTQSQVRKAQAFYAQQHVQSQQQQQQQQQARVAPSGPASGATTAAAGASDGGAS